MSEATKPRPRPDRFDVLCKRIYIEAKKQGLSTDQVHDIVRDMTNGEVESTKRLWPHERKQLLRSISGDGPYAASKEQMWLIENVFLARLRWDWPTFSKWILGAQTPISPPLRAQEILDAWPSQADLEARRIRVASVDAGRIIEGLKGLWMALLGIDDVNAEKRKIIRLRKLLRDRPGYLDHAFHQMKSQPPPE